VDLGFIGTSSVRDIVKHFDWRETTDDNDWTLFWTDRSVSTERAMKMTSYQVRSDSAFVSPFEVLLFLPIPRKSTTFRA